MFLCSKDVILGELHVFHRHFKWHPVYYLLFIFIIREKSKVMLSDKTASSLANFLRRLALSSGAHGLGVREEERVGTNQNIPMR